MGFSITCAALPTKRLMAVAIALSEGCQNCIMSHTEAALDLGTRKKRIIPAVIPGKIKKSLKDFLIFI
ncbi:MAG: hypothetical protein GY749_14825 [Desulfobacteraceae bacterium]|nr:hypothetical protein [Desulfobacteraceae bacterium]